MFGARRRREAARTVALEVDGEGARRQLADGRVETLTWAELASVDVVVLPKGPWGERVRLVLHGDEELRGLLVPYDVADQHGLVAALTRLRGFDHRRFTEVVTSTRAGTTEVWRRPLP